MEAFVIFVIGEGLFRIIWATKYLKLLILYLKRGFLEFFEPQNNWIA